MRQLISTLVAVLGLAPSVALGDFPPLQTVVTNRPDHPVPVQGTVVVADLPREQAWDRFDQTVMCFGNGPSFQCDATWEGAVIIERLSAHCGASSGSVWVLKVVTSIGLSAPVPPPDKLSVSAGPGATSASVADGARRYLALTSLPSLTPTPIVTTLPPLAMSALVPRDRIARLIFEGDMGSANCFVAFSGRWLR